MRIHNEAVYTAAQIYIRGALSVIPVRPDGSKKPTVKWDTYQERAATEDELRRWFAGEPHARGIAIIGGRVSGNLEVVDFDDGALYEDFLAIVADTGLSAIVDVLPVVFTPSGGAHLYYRCEEAPAGNQRLAWKLHPVPEGAEIVMRDKGKWVKRGTKELPVIQDEGGREWVKQIGIETRGEGGYVLAPPSPGACHASGKPYELLQGNLGAIPVITAADRRVLLALAQTLNEYLEPAQKPREGASRPRTGAGLRPGEDYNVRGDYEAVLEAHGWQRVGRHGDRTLWRRPGKTEGLSATGNYAGSGVFYVFSSNGHPFEADRSYTPFGVYALLEHGGDYTAAARRLGEEGYGEQRPPAAKSPPGPSDEDAPPAKGAIRSAGFADDVDEEELAGEGCEIPFLEALVDCGKNGPPVLLLAESWAQKSVDEFIYVEGDQWWRYKNDYWRYSSIEYAQASVQSFLLCCKRKGVKVAVRGALINEILFLAKSILGPISPSRFDSNPAWLPLGNGIYDLDTGSLIDHDPKLLLTRKASFPFDAAAVCPEWEAFLQEVLIDTEGRPCQPWLDLMQEWFGYCLTPDNRAELAMFWVGSGGNGKGVTTRVLEKLVGSEFCTAVPIEMLHDPYHRAELHGKLVGFVNEPDPKAVAKNSNPFKAIVSGDMLSARRPTEKVFYFKPTLRIVLSCNELPSTSDPTWGFFRRVGLIEWRFDVDKAKPRRDTRLAERLIAELPGIFNWAVEGLRRFRGRGNFEIPLESQELLRAYQKSEDGFRRFIDECCCQGVNAKVKAAEIHRAYMRWARAGGERAMTAAAFGRRMSKEGFKSKPSDGRAGDGGRYYSGIMLMDETLPDTLPLG